jgi:hypothetical protein
VIETRQMSTAQDAKAWLALAREAYPDADTFTIPRRFILFEERLPLVSTWTKDDDAVHAALEKLQLDGG